MEADSHASVQRLASRFIAVLHTHCNAPSLQPTFPSAERTHRHRPDLLEEMGEPRPEQRLLIGISRALNDISLSIRNVSHYDDAALFILL